MSLALLLVLGGSTVALAQPSVEIEWSTTGAGPIMNPDVAAEVGDTLTATIYLENVGDTIFAYTIEASFDASELSLVTATEFLPAGFTTNLNVGTANSGLCSGLMFEAVTLPAAGIGGRFAIGELVLDVHTVIADGMPDLTTGPCSGTTDEAIYDGSLIDVTASTTFESGGTVPASIVPVLGTGGWIALASLLALSALLIVGRASVGAGVTR
jgi:hypothetical protein